ncbi:MAG: DUF697 domain-containing protein [Bacilli bacterium]
MKKRNKFWILIGIGVCIVFLLIIVSSVISVGERLRTISKYLEYGFYGLSVILLWFLIINPLRIILFSPTFSIVTVLEDVDSTDFKVYQKVASNMLKNELISDDEKEKIRNNIRNRQELVPVMNKVFDTTIKKEINKIIFKNAKTVMISTAISQNGRLDMITVLSVNLKMIKEIVVKCGFRPSYPKLGKLSLNVMMTSLIAESLEGLDVNDLFPQSTANFLAELPLVKPIMNSFVQGMSNALLTMRVGFVTRKYLFSDAKSPSKDDIRRSAIKESIKMLPGVIAEVIAYFPSKIVKLFTKKDKNTEETVTE